MAAPSTPEPQAQFDKRTARLRSQLDAKSSLFDVLSLLSARKLLNGAAAEDDKLQKAIRSISRSNIVMLCFMGLFLVFQVTERSTNHSPSGMIYYVVILSLVLGLGQSAVVAIRLLYARVVALEAEIRELRRIPLAPLADTTFRAPGGA